MKQKRKIEYSKIGSIVTCIYTILQMPIYTKNPKWFDDDVCQNQEK
jgi:hypothetical protein